MRDELVLRFDSQSEAYRGAFDAFLRHTDQKDKARAWLERAVEDLPRRDVFLDAGAGEGSTTAWLAESFERTIAVEPNAYLRQRLEQACPAAGIVPRTILEAEIESRADFVLCSHVFYYIDDDAWVAHLERLASWLAPAGSLVVVMQNPESDCMRMLRNFFGKREGLGDLKESFERADHRDFTAEIDTVPCHVAAPDFKIAYTVAEFMVNTMASGQPLLQSELLSYVDSTFRTPDGDYRFSCTQDFLTIRHRAGRSFD